MRVCQNVISVLPVAIEMAYEVIGNVSMFGWKPVFDCLLDATLTVGISKSDLNTLIRNS